MPSFGTHSARNLLTCHQDLQTLFHYVIKTFDCTIIYGHRSVEKQFELYKIGRELRDGRWIKTGNVVTFKDGINNKSKHNESPSHAVDAVPYPIDWRDMNRMRYFAGYVKGCAQMLYEYGAISHVIVSGVDWDNDTDLNDQRFLDVPHFQIQS